MLEKKIIFKSKYKDILIHPTPIKKLLPEWFKKLPNYDGKKEAFINATAKKCVPLLDTFTSGYAILNPIDIIFWYDEVDGQKGINWRTPDSLNLDKYPHINLGVTTHTKNQINIGFVRRDEMDFPFKYLNPWLIQTPKNYSCLFTNPFNYGHDRGLRILDGIVDTDVYYDKVNFPFFLKGFREGESFMLKKGDPVALVFPFLRNKWSMEIETLDEREHLGEMFKIFNNLVNNYRSKIWSKKTYD